MRPSWLCQKTESPSSRSSARLGHSRKLVRQLVRGERNDVTMSSGLGKVRWTCTCHGSTISGRPALATGPSFGAA